MCTYVDWKDLSNTGTSVPYQQGKLVKFKVMSDKDAKGRPNRKYAWVKGHGCNTGYKKYPEQLHRELESPGEQKSRAVAMDGIRRAAGPYYRDDDRYLTPGDNGSAVQPLYFGTGRKNTRRRSGTTATPSH